jgi:acetate kinase
MLIVIEPRQNKIAMKSYGKNGKAPAVREYPWDPQDPASARALRRALKRAAGAERVEAVSFHLRSGGESFGGPAKIDRDFLTRLSLLSASFPLYIPPVLALLELFHEELKAPQFAFFESSILPGLPESEKLYPLASAYAAAGNTAKWGYHGVFHGAHAAMFGREQKVISIVLDRFTTVCAVNCGVPAAISLGCTPLEGIMSEKSCGDVDPGMIVYLMKERGISMYRLDEMLKEESGFLGMTGFGLPLPELAKLYGKNAKVTLAFDVYKNQLLKYIGDYTALMKGVDAVVFAGGYVPGLGSVIYSLAKNMDFLGVTLAKMPWKGGDELVRITSKESLKHIYINTLDEGEIICRQTRKYLSA